jgi:hypothetical protein
MTEWILGITDVHPARWKNVEPIWEDEQIIVSSSRTFNSLMGKLCDTAIKSRREYDHGINEHLWNMKILPLNEAMDPNLEQQRRLERLMDREDCEDSSDEDEDKENSRERYIIESPGHGGMRDDYEEEGEVTVLGSRTLHEDLLSSGSVIKVTYDYGTTTLIYLKVLSINRNSEVRSLIHYFTLEEDTEKLLKSIQEVPAFKLPKEKQVDHFFPTAAKAFLGYYIPLFKQTSSHESDDDDGPLEQNKKVMGSMTVGLSSRVRSDQDTTFCSMENRTCSADLLFCPAILDPNELLEAVESAWQSCDPQTRS